MREPFSVVHINRHSRTRGITHATLTPWLEYLLTAEGFKDGEVSLTFLDNEAMTALNERYTGRPGTTDVLAFSQQEGDDKAPDAMLLGDVIVDTTQVHSQARGHGVDPTEELIRVVAHGFLHLLGYGHKTPGEAKRMREAENRYVELYFDKRGKQRCD
jgi:rRNA maturation RNase YbeY